MEADEIKTMVNEAIEAATAPLRGFIDQVKQDQQDREKAAQEASKGGVSPSVQTWLNDKATGGLGGKDLFGKTPFNPNPKPRTNEKIV